jgi:hypothetical protein
MFEPWDGFYLLTGSAAAGLTGLMFVVASLTTNHSRDLALRGAKIYMTPTLFHFATVLVLSALTAVPGLVPNAAGLVVGAAGVAGAVYGVRITREIRKSTGLPPAHWSDLWFYGVAPCVLYVALIAAAVVVGASTAGALYFLGAVVMALLLAAIRNAWDLVTWLAPSANEIKR